MFQKSHLPDWIVFFLAGGSLYFVYGLDAKRLLETLLQWTFAVSAFKILIDYGLIKGIFSEERIDSTMRKIPIFTNLSMKKFKYKRE
ncbi:MAG: hypothetical protein AABX84_02160 [Nanoarchaeota archaeon]